MVKVIHIDSKGATRTLQHISNSTLLCTLRHAVVDATGLQKHQQRFVVHGREVASQHDDTPLRDLGIQDSDCVLAMMRPVNACEEWLAYGKCSAGSRCRQRASHIIGNSPRYALHLAQEKQLKQEQLQPTQQRRTHALDIRDASEAPSTAGAPACPPADTRQGGSYKVVQNTSPSLDQHPTQHLMYPTPTPALASTSPSQPLRFGSFVVTPQAHIQQTNIAAQQSLQIVEASWGTPQATGPTFVQPQHQHDVRPNYGMLQQQRDTNDPWSSPEASSSTSPFSSMSGSLEDVMPMLQLGNALSTPAFAKTNSHPPVSRLKQPAIVPIYSNDQRRLDPKCSIPAMSGSVSISPGASPAEAQRPLEIPKIAFIPPKPKIDITSSLNVQAKPFQPASVSSTSAGLHEKEDSVLGSPLSSSDDDELSGALDKSERWQLMRVREFCVPEACLEHYGELDAMETDLVFFEGELAREDRMVARQKETEEFRMFSKRLKKHHCVEREHGETSVAA